MERIFMYLELELYLSGKHKVKSNLVLFSLQVFLQKKCPVYILMGMLWAPTLCTQRPLLYKATVILPGYPRVPKVTILKWHFVKL